MIKNGLSYGFIQKLAVLYLVIWTITPPLSIDLTYRLLALGCVVVWLVIWIVRENCIALSKSQLLSVVFLLVVLTVIYIEENEFSSLIRQISMIMLVICFLMNNYYRDKWSELTGIIPIVLILLMVFNFNTVKVLMDDPTIARLLVRDDESTYQYLRQGIGGYTLVYPQVCVSPIIFAWIIKAFKNSKLYFLMGAVWAVSYIWLLSLAGYSIAIFTTCVGLILLLFYRGKSSIWAFIITIGVFVSIMASILYVESFRNGLLEFFDGTAVAKKINDLVSTSETGETGESIQVRIDRYASSIRKIIQYPVIGTLWRASGGGHSAFLDVVSKYGVFGGIMFSKLFYATPVHYKNNYENKFIIAVANAALVAYLFVSLFDSVPYQFTCMVLLVAPLFFEDIIKWTGAEKQ